MDRSSTPTKVSHFLEASTRWLVRHPRIVLATGFLLALIGVHGAITQLSFKTQRQDLIDPSSEFHGRWLAYVEEFGANDEIVVVVEGSETDAIHEAVDFIARELNDSPERFSQVRSRRPGLASVLSTLPHSKLVELNQWLDSLQNQLRQGSLGPGKTIPSSPVATTDIVGGMPSTYLEVVPGRMAVVLARLAPRRGGFVPDAAPFQQLGDIVAETRAREPSVRVGATGIPVLEYAEMQTSQMDMTWAGVTSATGVAFVFWLGFGSFRLPVMGLIALGLGIAWTFGFLTWTVGHLNILSVSFGAILVGLGIDFAIHYITRYLDLRTLTPDAPREDLIESTASSAGPPILAGAITTSTAFFTTATTDFRGVAELGWIAGGGVLICMVVTLTMLPCLIQRFDASQIQSTRSAPHFGLLACLRPIWRQPLESVAATVAVTGFTLTGFANLKYDHNLLNLQARDLECVAWANRLAEESSHGIWYAVSIADSVGESALRRRAFEVLDVVDHVEDVSQHLSTESTPERRRLIRQFENRLSNLVSSLSMQVDARTLPPQFANLLDTLVDWHDELQSTPNTAADLPPWVEAELIGQTGKFLLRIHPKENVTDIEPLRRFVEQVTLVDPQITGTPIQNYYAGNQMLTSFLVAGALAAVVVVAILILDLGWNGDVMFAALPTALGLLQLFGLMGLLEIPVNPANIIVLPLIIGIGIDDGIHAVHDFRRNPSQFGLSRSTLGGITLTTATSMIGFGSLMAARHEGLQSLGYVATLGIGCCWIASVVTLPCLYRFFR